MIRKAILGTIVPLILIGVLTLTSSNQIVKAGTITVPDDYPTIQEAINKANEGDAVFVGAGTYYENVVVNKTVSLLGENKETTIIDGGQAGDVVNIKASGVKITGFTIRNGGSRPSTAYASVRLSTSGNSILNNNLTDSWCGVWMETHSDYNLIANNTITGNLNGIAGQICHNTKITNNTIEDNLMGIWIGPYSENNLVSFNNITDHRTEGIMMMQSSNNTFEGNNIVDNNQGGFSAGITIGFQRGFSSGNKFFHNNIANMGKQIELQNEPEPIVWDDGYPSGGNYWGDYVTRYPHAHELDNSGIWDTPYYIEEDNQDNYPLMKPWGSTAPTPPTPRSITAKVDFDHDNLNLKSRGKWITAHIQLPKEYDPADSNASTILLNGTIAPVLNPKYGFVRSASEHLGNHNGDGVLELMIRFDRATVVSWIYHSAGMQHEIALTITGELTDGTPFEGTDTILAFWQSRRSPTER